MAKKTYTFKIKGYKIPWIFRIAILIIGFWILTAVASFMFAFVMVVIILALIISAYDFFKSKF